MKARRPGSRKLRLVRGFSFVELLMAIAIAATVITVAVLAYSTMARSNTRLRSIGEVELPAGTLSGLYDFNTNKVTTYFAPNYGRAALAEALRDRLYEDVGRANAVYCLVRSDANRLTTSSRPTTNFTISTNYDARRLDTPNAFRSILPTAAANKFTTYSGVPGTNTLRNLSIFILTPSDGPERLGLRSIYELDFVNAVSPAGTYASVRRYERGACTDYYDVFYPSSTLTVAFHPVVAYFERATGSGPSLYRQAAHRPFYFVWWPDPTSPTLEEAVEGLPAVSGSDVRFEYRGMTGRTPFFMVLPAFPSL